MVRRSSPICQGAIQKAVGREGRPPPPDAARTCRPALVDRLTAFLADFPCGRGGWGGRVRGSPSRKREGSRRHEITALPRPRAPHLAAAGHLWRLVGGWGDGGGREGGREWGVGESRRKVKGGGASSFPRGSIPSHDAPLSLPSPLLVLPSRPHFPTPSPPPPTPPNPPKMPPKAEKKPKAAGDKKPAAKTTKKPRADGKKKRSACPLERAGRAPPPSSRGGAAARC